MEQVVHEVAGDSKRHRAHAMSLCCIALMSKPWDEYYEKMIATYREYSVIRYTYSTLLCPVYATEIPQIDSR